MTNSYVNVLDRDEKVERYRHELGQTANNLSDEEVIHIAESRATLTGYDAWKADRDRLHQEAMNRLGFTEMLEVGKRQREAEAALSPERLAARILSLEIEVRQLKDELANAKGVR
jgi:hypothetical protein